MSDATETTQKPAEVAKAGEPIRAQFPSKNQETPPVSNMGPNPAASGFTEPIIDPAKEKTGDDQNQNQPAVLSEEQLKGLTDEQLKTILAGKGIQFEGDFEAMKSKLSQTAPAPEPTAEEKSLAEAAFQKRMLDHYIENGGTAEQFVAVSQVASMDLTQLSVAELKKELKEKNFSDAEIEVVLTERYYQINPDELEQGEESNEEFAKRKELVKKKVAYGQEKLNAYSTHTQNSAKTILDNLRETIKAQDLQKQTENEFLSKVDENSKKVSRELTYELGEVDNTKIEPVTIKVTEAQVAKVVENLKDKEWRKQHSITTDDTTNLPTLMNVLLRNEILESALKATLIEGGNRQVAIFQKRFPGTPNALGVGGSPQTNQGSNKIAKAGEPVRQAVRQQ